MSKENLYRATEKELANVRHALDQSAIVAITDKKGDIIHVNEKFCEISKYSRNELLGQNHRILNSGYHPKEFFVDMWKTIANGRVWTGEIKNQAKDGSYYWVYTTIVPFLDDRGRPFQYVSIRFEITDRKEAEEKLKEYAVKLEESNRELQDFASIAAHDLQEPLRKIQAFGDRLSTKCGDVLPESGKDYLQRMLGASRRMQDLINALLTYSRVTTRAQPFAPVSLRRIVDEVLSDLVVRIEQTKAEVVVEDLPTIDADATQVRQLFQNLIANALKFHKPGESPKVRIRGETEKGVAHIFVEDSGIGFEARYLDRIFTIFQRLHGRLEYEGTGVGLAVCRRIVERHHGQITAQSEPGQGATFVVSLPVKQRSGVRKNESQ